MTTIIVAAPEVEAMAQKYADTATAVTAGLNRVQQAVDQLSATFIGDTAGTFFADFANAMTYLRTISPQLTDAHDRLIQYETEIAQTEGEQQGLWNRLWELIVALEGTFGTPGQ